MAEQDIRRHHEAGDMEAATTAALETYGREVFGYLVATMRDETEASEVFGDLCEDLWRGIEGFAWRSSFRTWLYVLARHAAARHRRRPQHRRERRLGTSQLSGLAEQIRTATLTHHKTEVKDAFAELRRQLDPDDQTLLILRVDRRMAWNDIAEVLGDGEDRGKTAARLRKRFQLLKDRLRAKARETGLIGS